LSSLTFFFDRCFGKRFPQVLLKIPKTPFVVEYYFEKKHGFDDTTEDDVWLTAIAGDKWVALSHDKLYKNPMAVAAIKQHRIRCFCLEGGDAPIWDKITVLARGFQGIREAVGSERPPYIYLVSRAGKLKRIDI